MVRVGIASSGGGQGYAGVAVYAESVNVARPRERKRGELRRSEVQANGDLLNVAGARE